MPKVNKKYIEKKYKGEKFIEHDDVRLLIKDYEHRIKRLKFLLNSYIKDSDRWYCELFWNKVCNDKYAKDWARAYAKQLEEIDEDAIKQLDEYLDKQKNYRFEQNMILEKHGVN